MERKDSIKKNVWIMNHYATNTFDDKSGRHYLFAKHLRSQGYNPTVFCANTYHDNRTSVDTKGNKYVLEEDGNARFVFVKTSEYKGNGFSRIKNMITFTQNLSKVAKSYMRDGGERPDVIIASSVHPLICVVGIKIAKKLGVPCIVEIRDLWPESIVEYSSRLTKKNLIIKSLYKLEKWIYKKADKIIFTMEGGKDYIVDQGWDKEINLDKVVHINNGVDLEKFDYNKENFKIEDEDLNNDELIKLIYTGSIRRVNNVGLLLDVAKKIEDPRVGFLIWGDGNEVENLKNRVTSERIVNVKFKGKVDKKYIPYILSKADLNLCHNTESDLFKYGISFNKLFEYYAAGKPILIDFETNFNPIIKNNCGITGAGDRLPKTIEAFVKASNSEKIAMGENAGKVAKEYDFVNLTSKLVEVIESSILKERNIAIY